MISTADALNWGFTGPILRSTGVPRDLRKDAPYLAYAELDFDVPGGHQGRQLRPLLRAHARDGRVGLHDPPAACEMLPEGPINVDDRALHAARQGSSSTREIEALIHHFKLVMDGLAVPAGEVYVRARGAQRRARLLPRQRRRRHALQGARALAELRAHGRRAPAARGLPARRHRADLRLDEHDRRGVRPMSAMKHLIPEFDDAARALSRRASSRRWCCRACAASRKTRLRRRRATSTASSRYLGVPRIQVEEVL